ncbi:hypothetical protein H9Q69_000091 [Fusarium xylarioides]|nr:hypothetical protein H9Q69_000091 [Fusarium xylarioides]
MSMSASFETYYPIVATKLKQNAQAVAGWGVLTAVCFGVFVFWSFTVDAGMPKLPIAMKDELPDRKQRIDMFIKDTRRLLIDSCNKFSMRKYTKVGNLDEKKISLVNKKLNPTLPQYIPVIQELIRRHWPLQEFETKADTKPWPHVMRLVSRISTRMFQGADSAENDRWLDIASDHRFEQGKALVAQMLQTKKAKGGEPLSNPPALLDYLYDSRLGPDDVEAHTITQINLCVAAIQSMASTVTQCLMDLATHPDYAAELLEELHTTVKKNNGVIDKRVLTDLWKLDSFIKETQRLNPPDLNAASFQRKALSSVTLSNGLRIPKGARIVLPTGAINMNRELFQDPETFDGFRSYKIRMASEEARNTSQMVTVGKKDLTWGYGRHACPGRYIAEVVVKLLTIEFLTRYDIRLPDDTKERPKNIEFEGLVIPDPEWRLSMKKR